MLRTNIGFSTSHRDRRGRDRIVVGFTTNCTISAYHHYMCEVYSMQHYVIKFVSELRQVGDFLRVLWFPPPMKTDRHDIAEILLKVRLSTIKQTKKQTL